MEERAPLRVTTPVHRGNGRGFLVARRPSAKRSRTKTAPLRGSDTHRTPSSWPSGAQVYPGDRRRRSLRKIHEQSLAVARRCRSQFPNLATVSSSPTRRRLTQPALNHRPRVLFLAVSWHLRPGCRTPHPARPSLRRVRLYGVQSRALCPTTAPQHCPRWPPRTRNRVLRSQLRPLLPHGPASQIPLSAQSVRAEPVAQLGANAHAPPPLAGRKRLCRCQQRKTPRSHCLVWTPLPPPEDPWICIECRHEGCAHLFRLVCGLQRAGNR